jgi:leucyl aminopeptidase
MEIISVQIKARKVDAAKCKTDVVAVGICSDDKKPAGVAAQLDKKLGGAIARVMRLGDFKAKANAATVIYGGGVIGAARVLLVGLGQRKKATLESMRKAAATAANQAVAMQAKSLALAIHQAVAQQFETQQLAQAIAEGAYFGAYRWDEYVTKQENGRSKKLLVEVVDAGSLKQLDKGIRVGAVIGQVQSFARTVANRPANIVNPAALADIAKKTARETRGLSCMVLDENQLKQKRMGAILAVGMGSVNKPRLIVLKYNGGRAKGKSVAIAGKAITFDSGGINIKPSQGMEEMKFDKSGGVAVLAVMKAAAELKLPINLYGLIPSAENMPGGSSSRPGEIVKTFSGKTIEFLNTDAEGRMVLCDALAWAAKQKVDAIVDIATLTGACMVALGRYKAGLMGNNDELIEQLKKAAEASGEAVWHMPSGEEYLDEMKSKVADLKNIGSRWGGACNGAAFLGQFVNDIPWAHIDMAGVDLFDSPKSYTSVGSSGYGVRLLIYYLLSLVKY